MKVKNERYIKEYPNCPSEFPDELLNNDWSLRIHGQTLQRMNERGGMNPMELIVNIEKKNYRAFDSLEVGPCIEKLIEYLQPSISTK
jgi:hypothetical protein